MRFSPSLLTAVAVLSVAAVPVLRGARGPGVGDAAPEISAESWSNHLGPAPALADLRGHAVLVEFWATW